MPNFFDKQFSEQVKEAIDRNDPKLVQVLLGSEFCQLWQYWLAHAMISYNILAIERDTQCNLPLRIIKNQREVLQQSLTLLRNRKQALEGNEQVFALEGEERNLADIQNLMSRLFRNARQVAEDHKRIIEQENIPGTNYLYCTSNESTTRRNNSTDIAVRAENEIGIPGYTAYSLRNVSEVTQLNFIEGCNNLIDEMEKMIVGKVWNTTNQSTKFGYYLNEVSNYITGENGQLLDEAVNYIPNNRYIASLRRCLAVIRPVVSGLQMANDYISNDLQRISCVNNRIGEISRISSELDSMAKEKGRLKEQLLEARQEVKEKAVDKMTDGKLLGKEFVHIMYEKLLNYYLMKAKVDKENLLHFDVENNGISEVKRRILDQAKSIDVNVIGELLNYAMGKNQEANVEVISVLLVNLAHVLHLCDNLIGKCENEKIKRLLEKSNNTIMIDVHDSLFDFSDRLVNLVSVFPTKEGYFDKRSSENKITLEEIGGEKYKKIVTGIKALKEELDKKEQMWKDKENRDEWRIFKPFYMIYDLIYKGLNEEQRSIPCGWAMELHRRALYADQFKDEGIMYDHVKKMREEDVTSDKEVKNYIERLCGIANLNWEKAKVKYKLVSFLEDTGKMVAELKERKFQETEQERKQAVQARQEAVQARQEAVQARQETELGRQAAEHKAAKLEEMLRRMGVDPDTVLDDVNVSQSASAGMGIN